MIASAVDDPIDHDRRLLLRALACLVPTMACATTSSTTPAPALPSAPIPEAVAALGRQYLAAHPEDADRDALRHALGLHDPAPEPTRFARIDAALRRDLDRGDVVLLDGWQLTRTECRLYALVALA